MKKQINLFIDTNVFIRQHFNFNSGRLLNLSNLSKQGFVKLYITDIVDREIQKNIYESIQSEFIGCKITKNVINLNLQDIISQCMRNYEKYKRDNLNIISCFVKDISKEVFDKYFSNKPPFDTKKESKKYEFPDAFNIESVKNWAEKNNTTVTFLSADQDFKTYIDSVSCIKYETNIENLLNALNKQSKLYNKTKELFNALKQDILEDLKSDIFNLSLSDYDIYFHSQREYMDGCFDPDYELYDFQIDEESFSIVEPFNILDIDEKNECAEIESTLTYKINALFEETDYSCAIYDKEDGIRYGVQYNNHEGNYIIKINFYATVDMKKNSINAIGYDSEKPNPQIRFFECI